MLAKLKNLGPGPLIAAAFIGPGTVTVCTLVGAEFRYALLWAMLLSIVATLVLQEMSARMGIVTQKGLSELIRSEIRHPGLRLAMVSLVLLAIVLGNTAYEAGNIAGARLGLSSYWPEMRFALFGLEMDFLAWFIGILAAIPLIMGKYRFLELFFLSLISLMSLSFLLSFFMMGPDWRAILRGLTAIENPPGSIWAIMGLIGTTVVPYNLFLHASLVKEKWKQTKDLRFARWDTLLSVVLGGLVSMSIIITSAASGLTEVSSAKDLAVGLEPVYGSTAKFLMSFGLFAAGISSAITAPLAAAYTAEGLFAWKKGMRSRNFRLMALGILFIGVFLSSLDFKPVEVIRIAQIANGLLLPIVSAALLILINKTQIMGKYKNGPLHNVLGIFILGVTIFLGVKSIWSVFQTL